MKYVSRSFTIHVGMWILLITSAFPALAETPITSCGFIIDTPGNYVLNADLTCGTTWGIDITASNVSLKLNGHKITMLGGGQGQPRVTAISVSGGSNPSGVADHVGIQGPGLIVPPEFGTGISLTNVSYSQVSEVTIVAQSIAVGIRASSCHFLTLASNVIGHSSTGVSVDLSGSISVTGNDVSGNTVGINLLREFGDSIGNNIANGNSYAGILINAANALRVYGNVTNGNGEYGISMNGISSRVFNNTSKGNGLFDLAEGTSCFALWSDNVFFTASAPCIH